MKIAERIATFMESVAADDSHGYDQKFRWGQYGDYDCSSLVITAVEHAGLPVKTMYGATYTGNMLNAFIKCGFIDVTKYVDLTTCVGMQRGDILLNPSRHVEVYAGNGKKVGAHISETGGIYAETAGDQTGSEISKNNYTNFGIKHVLRYDADEIYTPVIDTGSYVVKYGDCLSNIANRYGTSWQQLARINHLTNPNLIKVGQVLRLKEERKSNEEIAREVILGRWGNGRVRKQKLESAGYDYYIIQELVNEKLK